MQSIDKLDSKQYILIKNARLHNLKNIDLAIPKNQLVVITGLSGSGKSTLAFDTLYAEGQRRYVESLSSYARQFLGKLDKPLVDSIKGIAPAIAIEQKVISSNPRSTIGTTTEIYDYLKLLYARIGETYSPISGKLVKKDSVTDVVEHIKSLNKNLKVLLLAGFLKDESRDFQSQLSIYQQQGFSRVDIDGRIVKIQDLIQFGFEPEENTNTFLIIDRFVTQENADDSFYHRLADSIQTAFYEGKGKLHLKLIDSNQVHEFSNEFSLDGMRFNEPSVIFFSFNNPFGACPTCEGYGKTIDIDEDLVIPNKNLSVYEDTIVVWKGDKTKKWKEQLIQHSEAINFPIHKPYFELNEEQKNILWQGKGKWKGIDGFFQMLEEKTYKIQNRVMLSRYRGRTQCRTCKGKRLRKETSYVKVGNKTIQHLIDLPLNELRVFFENLSFNKYQKVVAKRILLEIQNRLSFLEDVGLGYLTLNRASNTLSGGESQRINLATSLGSSLVGSMYILDEPSIGLHSNDTEKLIGILKKLCDLGNIVIVVEHDEDIMKQADYIIDIGPKAGTHGGEVVFEGTYKQLLKANSLTAKYLTQKEKIEIPKKRRPVKHSIQILGARHHNLKNVDVKFPLNMLTVITGVSGSGKSTLLKTILTPALQRNLGIYGQKPGAFERIDGDLDLIEKIEFINQNPIGKSSRSNPVTYVKAFDDIRDLFSKEKLSQIRNYKTKHFSFNVEGGRCEHCKGEGMITIEMQFMADVQLECEECNGSRFKKEILEVKFHNHHISDILNMTVDDALAFFIEHKQNKIVQKLQALQDVGLGYVQLGQSSNTLSGGEAQRIKLASFLNKGSNKEKTLFIFDEPSTGLHFHDIKKLLKSLNALIEVGHSIFVIEHHLDIIKSADWVIDLGPDGGKNGGNLIAEGTPETVAKSKGITARFLADKL